MTETMFEVGELIENRYRVLSVIGSGGMGTLYRVSDEAKDSEVVALKTVRLSDASAETPERVERFQREFRLLTQLRHPNLVSVYDFGITGEGELYFTMEWVEGRDLDPDKRHLEPAATVPLVVQICRALAYLHARGVIHGDLKPANVLTTEETGDGGRGVKIVDFGVALELRSPEARARYYTPGYSAPEVKEQRPVDHRADLYSLGALWYALLAGEPPMFMPGSGQERLIQFALDEALEVRGGVPAGIGQVVARLLATSPEDRYGSANEVIEAMNEATGSTYALETRDTASSYALRVHFVDREAELTVLQALWKEAQAGEGKLVLVGGESGVGKTRLVTELELQAELGGARVVWGQCVERGGDAYHPWREVLQVLVRYVEGADEATMQQVGPVLAVLLPELRERTYMAGLAPAAELEPQAAKLRLNDGIVKVMRAAAGLRPTVVVVENVHWADEATLELLRYLARVPGAVGLLVCVTYRSDEIGPEHPLVSIVGERVQRIPMQALPPEATTELVSSMLGLEQLPALLTERVQQTTGGNAFFVQELVRSLAVEGEVLRRTVEGWQVDEQALREAQLPESIRQVVGRRLAQLSEGAREVLEWAALVGVVFWEEVVAEAGQVTRAEVRAALGELLEQGLVVVRDETSFVGEREYLFVNPTVREVSYESIPREERGDVHGRVAAWLTARGEGEVGTHLGLIAEHLEQAGQVEQAATYLRRAGEQAVERFANAEAVDYLSRALDLTPEDDLAERYTLLLVRENARYMQGVLEARRQDLAVMNELAEALDDDHRRIEVALRQARLANGIGDSPAAIVAAQAAVRLAQAAQHIDAEAAGRMQWGRALWLCGEYEAAQFQLGRALTLAQAAGGRQASSRPPLDLSTGRRLGRVVEADCLRNLGNVSAQLGDFAGSRSYWEQALPIYREVGDRLGESIMLSNIGEASMSQGDYAAASAYLEQALHICREGGFQRHGAYARGNLGLAFMHLGDYSGATAHLEQALRICRETGFRRGEATELVYLGVLSCHLGDDEAVREYSQQALLVAREIGERDLQGRALTNLGRASAGLGNLAEAAECYEQALTLRRELGQQSLAIESLADLACVSLAQGNLGQAQARVEEALSHMKSRVLDGMGEPFRVHLTCYRVLRASQDPRAHDILSEAHRLLQEQAARITDEELRRSFLENMPEHREIVREWADQRESE